MIRATYYLTLSLLLSSCGFFSTPPAVPTVPISITTPSQANAPQPSQISELWQSPLFDITEPDSVGAEVFSWSPDSQKIYWTSDAAGYVWKASNGGLVKKKVLRGCGVPNTENPLSPDGSKLYCNGSVYDAISFSLLYILPSSSYNRAAWSPDGKKILLYLTDIYISDHSAYIYDAKNGLPITKIAKLPNLDVGFLEWSADGNRVIVGNKIYDANTGIIIETISTQMTQGKISYDWKYFVYSVVNYDNTTQQYVVESHVIDFKNGSAILNTLQYSSGEPFYAWSADGKKLAIGFNDQIELWDIISGQKVGQFVPPSANTTYRRLTSIQFSPNGNKISAEYKENGTSIIVWDITRQSIEVKIDTTISRSIISHVTNVYNLAISPISGYLYSVSRDGNLLRWQQDDGALSSKTSLSSDVVYSMSIKPKSDEFVTSGNDTQIRLWSAGEKPEVKKILNGHTYTVRSLAWNFDGSSLASGSWDSSVRLWNPITGEQTAVAKAEAYVNGVAFKPGAGLLASAGDDGFIRLWNTPSLELNKKWLGHTDSVLCLAWSPDGQYLATGGALGDRNIKIWLVDGTLVQTLKGSLGAVRSLVWSSNSQTLFSAGDDKAVRIWNAQTGKQVLEKTSSEQPIFSLALSADDKTLFGGSADGLVQAWSVQ